MRTLYQNIKRLREQNGLSQDALAKLTGYSDRSSIAKIEKGLVDLQHSKIEIFAEVLHTTPSILAGWDHPSVSKLHVLPDCSENETVLLNEYRKMNRKGKKRLLETAQDMNCSPLYNNNFEIELKAAHERTDLEVTDEMIEADNEIMDDENF